MKATENTEVKEIEEIKENPVLLCFTNPFRPQGIL